MSDTPRTDAELKRIADQLDGGEDNAAYVLSQLGAHACMLEREVERLRAELLNIADISKRHDIAKCDGLAEWADWAQNRARHAALKEPK
jgi:5,10-methylenetetrahydrofolate reductase